MKLLGIAQWLVLGVALTGSAIGCKDDPPAPSPDTNAAASRTKGKSPRPQAPKVSPQANKEFFVDVCAMGTQGLRLTRDAYMASLKGGEPGPETIPSFGEFPEIEAAGRPPVPAASAAPAASGSAAASGTAAATAAPKATTTPTAAPKATAAPTATAAASAAPTATPVDRPEPLGRGPKPRAGRIPYQRHFGRCTSAAGVAGADAPALDPALKAYAEYVRELSKELNQSSAYYTNKLYEKDNFEKGKQYHKRLVELFGQLDEKLGALDTAYASWAKDVPALPDKLDSGGDITMAAIKRARLVAVGFVAKEPDAAAIRTDLEALEGLSGDLSEDQKSNPSGLFGKRVLPRLQSFIRTATDAFQKIESKSLTPNDVYGVSAAFTTFAEGKNQALMSFLTQSAAKGGPHGAGLARPNLGGRRGPPGGPAHDEPTPE